MSDKKIRILMAPSDSMGVGSWRNIWPAQSIEEHFSDEFQVDIKIPIDLNDMDYLKSFDIIHFHRHLGGYDSMEKVSKELKAAGVILVMDIDDWWDPPTTHPLYELVKKEKIAEKVIKNLTYADYITTTTDIFKSYILKHNKNVEVIPNAIDMNHRMWKSQVVENTSGKCRIGMICGSSHLYDLKLLEQSITILNSSSELKDKYQIVLCGFDTRGSMTELMPDGSTRQRPIQPQETVWVNYEQIFTSSYKLIRHNPEYINWLKKAKKGDFPGEENENYVRRWTLPLTQYAKHYDYCDVCLAPLLEVEENKDAKGTIKKTVNYFNEVKSELKIMESGMKHKALIAQDFGIYKELIKNGETGILVNNNKDGWYKALRKVILDSEYRQMLADNLHNYVKDKYELKNVTAQRVEFYKRILKEKVDK